MKNLVGRMQFVKMRDGHELSVKVLGRGHRYVMLVHGIGGNHMSWEPFSWPFLRDFTFIIPNLRGFGESTHVPFNSTDVIKNFAEDLSDVLDSLVPPNEKIILCGLSMGAYTCYKFLEMRESRVSKYLNVDQCPKAMNSVDWDHGLVGRKQDYLFVKFKKLMDVAAPHRGTPFESLPAGVKSFYLDSLSDFFEAAFHRPFEIILVKSAIRFGFLPALKAVNAHMWESYYDCLHAYINMDYDFRKVCRTLSIPVTLCVGRYSEMYPIEGQVYIGDVAQNLENVIVFEESHALMYTSPIKFIKVFKEFLQK